MAQVSTNVEDHRAVTARRRRRRRRRARARAGRRAGRTRSAGGVRGLSGRRPGPRPEDPRGRARGRRVTSALSHVLSSTEKMAQTKRKRRSKHRGNAAGTIETRGRTGRPPSADERKKQTRATARERRLNTPPTWKSSLTKARRSPRCSCSSSCSSPPRVRTACRRRCCSPCSRWSCTCPRATTWRCSSIDRRQRA